jgi:hypothetical protein
MNSISQRRRNTALLLLILATLLMVSLEDSAQAQEKNVRVIFTIQIYSIDRLNRTAEVNVTLTFENLTSQQVAENEPIQAILIGGTVTVFVSCNKTLPNEYTGSSGLITWSVSGPLSRGEYIPFDEGQLLFQIANVLPGPFNSSEAEVDTNKSFTYLEGLRKSTLNETYVATGDAYVVSTYFEPNLRVIVPLKRRTDTYLLDPLFWLLIAPTLASYYVLASTLFLWNKEALSNRLRLYVALFIFSSTFMMAMQGQLPFRVTLAIPEVLLVNLMISTAVFSVSSVLPLKYETLEATVRDLLASFASLYIAVYLFTILTPIFPTKAWFVFWITLFSYGFSSGIALWKTTEFLRLRHPPPRIRGIFNRIRHPGSRIIIARVGGMCGLYTGLWFVLGRILGDEMMFWAGVIGVILGLFLLLLPNRFLCSTEAALSSNSRGGSGQFVGSRKSRVYHNLSCPSAKRISPENHIGFNDPTDAKKRKLKPCKICKPP